MSEKSQILSYNHNFGISNNQEYSKKLQKFNVYRTTIAVFGKTASTVTNTLILSNNSTMKTEVAQIGQYTKDKVTTKLVNTLPLEFDDGKETNSKNILMADVPFHVAFPKDESTTCFEFSPCKVPNISYTEGSLQKNLQFESAAICIPATYSTNECKSVFGDIIKRFMVNNVGFVVVITKLDHFGYDPSDLDHLRSELELEVPKTKIPDQILNLYKHLVDPLKVPKENISLLINPSGSKCRKGLDQVTSDQGIKLLYQLLNLSVTTVKHRK